MKNSLVIRLARAKILQSLWARLHSVSIVAMNYWGGSHYQTSGELWVIKSIVKSFPENLVFFDVGANQGNYALSVLGILNGANIYCFEPSANTYKVLQKNVDGLAEIKTYNFGFGDKVENLTLYTAVDSCGLSTIYADNPLTDFNSSEIIALNTLDNFCKTEGVSSIDFLKIDVEGHEYSVLLGARELIKAGKVKAIQFEMGECNISSRTFFRDFYKLLSTQYRIYRVLPHGIVEIKEYKTINEIFACINYVAFIK